MSLGSVLKSVGERKKTTLGCKGDHGNSRGGLELKRSEIYTATTSKECSSIGDKEQHGNGGTIGGECVSRIPTTNITDFARK